VNLSLVTIKDRGQEQHPDKIALYLLTYLLTYLQHVNVFDGVCDTAELSMGWVDPRVGLGWIGLVVGREFVFLVGRVGSWV